VRSSTLNRVLAQTASKPIVIDSASFYVAATELMNNVPLVAQMAAAQSTARWIHQNADRAPHFLTRMDMLEGICSGNLIDGSIAEFGVFTGAVTRFIRPRFPDRVYHAFDSFRGVPEQMSLSVSKWAFDQGGVVPKLPKDVTVHAGWFADTLPEYRKAYDEALALIYIDCDLYESVCEVLDGIQDQLRPGSILVFDDWYNFPNWEAHSYRAVNEFVARSGLSLVTIGITTTEHCVAFRVE
jgi:predicted O-methyltransferase YrrM